MTEKHVLQEWIGSDIITHQTVSLIHKTRKLKYTANYNNLCCGYNIVGCCRY